MCESRKLCVVAPAPVFPYLGSNVRFCHFVNTFDLYREGREIDAFVCCFGLLSLGSKNKSASWPSWGEAHHAMSLIPLDQGRNRRKIVVHSLEENVHVFISKSYVNYAVINKHSFSLRSFLV